jgi:pimeloyl-ACP methyl ester carboxylesterase
MGRVTVDGVSIEYEVSGEGRAVLLLHGFPDSGRLWRHQVPALAAAGFKVVVPDLRGYGRSDKPTAVEAYSLPLLAGDVMAILPIIASSPTTCPPSFCAPGNRCSGAYWPWSSGAALPGIMGRLLGRPS